MDRSTARETSAATSSEIVCTLTPRDLEDVGAAWRELFRTSLISREEVPGGLHLSFHPGGAAALHQLIDTERECCPWITFELDGPSVTLTSPGDGEQAIRNLWAAQPAA